jgi:hypothetical protein
VSPDAQKATAPTVALWANFKRLEIRVLTLAEYLCISSKASLKFERESLSPKGDEYALSGTGLSPVPESNINAESPHRRPTPC